MGGGGRRYLIPAKFPLELSGSAVFALSNAVKNGKSDVIILLLIRLKCA